MIYILSSEFDVSTQKIAKWLRLYKKDFCILNYEVKITGINLYVDQGDIDLMINIQGGGKYKINLAKDRFFYRRGVFRVNPFPDNMIEPNFISKFIKNEITTLGSFVENSLFHSSSNVITTKELNKLETLVLASQVGLKTPKTIISTYKKRIVDFKAEISPNDIISKPIYESLNVFLKDIGYLKTYTLLLNQEDVENLDEVFYPTLFQEKIQKWLDIRSFYLKGDFFSMAIFSQDDEKTAIDFRDYNFENPNKITPFLLPYAIKSKITRLFKKLQLDTGSIDLCLTKEHKFFFLEINPVGQYDMVSVPCNCYLDRELAKIL